MKKKKKKKERENKIGIWATWSQLDVYLQKKKDDAQFGWTMHVVGSHGLSRFGWTQIDY
jgi:hypothetical protein